MLKKVLFSINAVHQLVDYVASKPDVEVCGVLSGRFNFRYTMVHTSGVHPVTNIAQRPQTRFILDPAEQIQTMTSILKSGQELAGIFHSHPSGPPHPSTTDIVEMAYPDVAYCIVFPASLSLRKTDTHNTLAVGIWRLGVWQINDNTVTPVSLTITDK